MIARAATLGPTAYWYLTRATGVVSLLLLTAILVLGVLGPMRVAAGPRWPRFAIDSLHRDLSLLAIVFIAVHVVTTVLDGFAPIGLIDALVPLHSAYRPLWLGLGAVAFDLMLALVVTSLVRRRLGYRAWRAMHWLAYLSWPVAVLHGLGSGSDAKQAWALIVTFACVVAVAVAALARIARAERLPDAGRAGAAAAMVLTPIGLLAFAVLGPLAPRWAQRAGTPAALLFHPVVRTVPRRVVRPVPAVSRTLTLPFTAQLQGSERQAPAAGGAIVDLELRVSGGLTGALRIRLGGTPVGQGIAMTGSQVDLLADGLPGPLQGHVTALDGGRVTARVTGAPERPVELVADLQIDAATGTVAGSLTGRAAR